MTPQLPKVTWEQQLGDIGETEVKARLLRFATATKIERDVGIDYVCELLKDGTPDLPFSVQAKGTGHFDEHWKATIKKSTVVYWLTQFSPVFIIVYDEENGECFWVSVEELRYKLIEKMAANPQAETISFTMPKDNCLSKTSKPEALISAVLRGHESIQLARGYPHGKGQEYVQGLPDPPRTSLETRRIRYVIRNGMYAIIQYYLKLDDLTRARNTAEACTIFDDTHFTQFILLAEVEERSGRFEAAINSYRRADEILVRDPEWPTDSKQELLDEIQARIGRCTESHGE